MVKFAYKIQTTSDRRILKPVLESLKCVLYRFKVKNWGCQLLKNQFRASSWKSWQIAVKTRKGGWTEEQSVKNENMKIDLYAISTREAN